MLHDEDTLIIAWLRGQILHDTDQIDDVPPGPWRVDPAAHAIISAEQGTVTPVGNTQAIASYAEGQPGDPIMDVYDNRRRPVTADYVARHADPDTVRARQEAELAMLGDCHRILGVPGAEGPAHKLARRQLRQLAKIYAARDGYHPSWTPSATPLQLPVPEEVVLPTP